jgi:hypothetical protein
VNCCGVQFWGLSGSSGLFQSVGLTLCLVPSLSESCAWMSVETGCDGICPVFSSSFRILPIFFSKSPDDRSSGVVYADACIMRLVKVRSLENDVAATNAKRSVSYM